MDSIAVRRQQLENLNQFILASKMQMKFILKSFGWSGITDKKHIVTCPVNRNHSIPRKSLKDHTKKCSLQKYHYSTKDIFLSERCRLKPESNIRIDRAKKKEIFACAKSRIPNFKQEENVTKQNRILQEAWNNKDPDPKTQDRLITAYTTSERLALYNYSINATRGPAIIPEFNLHDAPEDNNELTYEEHLEQLRNSRRRRIKYKTVHTSRKNYTEVLRDVIENQMSTYEDYLVEKKRRRDERYRRSHKYHERDYSKSYGYINKTNEEKNYYSDYKYHNEEDYVMCKREQSRSHKDHERDYYKKYGYINKTKEKCYDGDYKYNNERRNKNHHENLKTDDSRSSYYSKKDEYKRIHDSKRKLRERDYYKHTEPTKRDYRYDKR